MRRPLQQLRLRHEVKESVDEPDAPVRWSVGMSPDSHRVQADFSCFQSVHSSRGKVSELNVSVLETYREETISSDTQNHSMPSKVQTTAQHIQDAIRKRGGYQLWASGGDNLVQATARRQQRREKRKLLGNMTEKQRSEVRGRPRL